MDLYPEDFTTVTIPMTTNDGSGAVIAPSSAFEVADFVIYKNGSATQKTSTNGLTISSPFDSATGVHMLVIDTSNDTGDSGFWVAGAVYDVLLLPDETVDGVAVAKWVGKFGLAVNVLPSFYSAFIQFTRDQANLKDEWLISWFKNGVPVTAGITTPVLTVVDRGNGTVVNARTPTQVGSTGVYKYDATSTSGAGSSNERTVVGEAVIATTTATIDGATRTFRWMMGRDSQ